MHSDRHLLASKEYIEGDTMNVQELMRTRIPLRVGSEFRIKSSGELTLGNPQPEPAGNTNAADAILLYHFDRRSGEHILRLLDAPMEGKFLRSNHRDDECRT